MKIILALSSLAAVLLIGGCASPGPSRDGRFTNLRTGASSLPGSTTLTNQLDPALLHPSSNLFTLGPGDRLQLQIIGSPETRATTTVGPDGKVYFYLLPGLDVWGLTLEQTRALMEKELANYINHPQVDITLREVGNKYVWLLGRFGHPGIYPLQSSMNLLEATALAGGTARSMSQANSEELADLRHSFLLRKGQIVPVDFWRLFREGDTSQNVVLQPDDFVYLPSALEQEVYVLGSVTAPRAVPYIEPMTLISAVTGGGGPLRWDFLSRGGESTVLLRDAYLSHVAVVRGSLAQPEVMIVDLDAIMKGRAPDVHLEAGDIIYVPNSPYRLLKSYVNLIVNTFVGTVAANEGIHAGSSSTGPIGISVPVSGGSTP